MSKKLEFESVNNSNRRYVKPAELADLDVLGVYRATEEGKFGPNHIITTDSGEELVINGFGSLNSQMLKVSAGETIKLVYKGKKKIEEGAMKGKEAHSVDVQRAKK
jgi:hypothetical protein